MPHQLKNKNCGFFFPRQLTEMIRSNLLLLIGKSLGLDLHGKICIAIFAATSHFYDFLFPSVISLNRDKCRETN